MHSESRPDVREAKRQSALNHCFHCFLSHHFQSIFCLETPLFSLYMLTVPARAAGTQARYTGDQIWLSCLLLLQLQSSLYLPTLSHRLIITATIFNTITYDRIHHHHHHYHHHHHHHHHHYHYQHRNCHHHHQLGVESQQNSHACRKSTIDRICDKAGARESGGKRWGRHCRGW